MLLDAFQSVQNSHSIYLINLSFNSLSIDSYILDSQILRIVSRTMISDQDRLNNALKLIDGLDQKI